MIRSWLPFYHYLYQVICSLLPVLIIERCIFFLTVMLLVQLFARGSELKHLMSNSEVTTTL